MQGIVEEVIYSNAENGYTVMSVDCSGEEVIATGYMPYVSEGEGIKLTGIWKNHPEYGRQLSVSAYEKEAPTSKTALMRYLASGIIKGIRLATAKKIVDKFGDETLSVIEAEPERLAQIRGISSAKAAQISIEYAHQQKFQSVAMFLQKFDIGMSLIMKVCKYYGSDAVNYIKQNPYVLSDDIYGLSFLKVDKIGLQLGVDVNDKRRLMAAIKYVLMQNAYGGGHTYVAKDKLISDIATNFSCDVAACENSLKALEIEKQVYTEFINETEAVFLSDFYTAERNIAAKVCALAGEKGFFSKAKAEAALKKWENENSIELADEQREAVKCALTGKIMIITGGPGTGKTTIVNAIVGIFKSSGYKVALAAPTGRAAKRISEITGFSAGTIHRLLEYEFNPEANDSGFKRNAFNPLEDDVIILDEASMIDVVLGADVMAAAKNGAGIVFVGDANQLPPVGAGNLLSDMIESGAVNVVRLTKIFRQAAKSLIVTNAHKIINGENPELKDRNSDFFFIENQSAEDTAKLICDLYEKRLPKAYGYDSLRQIQVLSPTKKGICGVGNLNKLLQQRINPPSGNKSEIKHGEYTFRTGDRVMQIRNNYDVEWKNKSSDDRGSGIFNGDMGFIENVDKMNRFLIIVFDDSKEVKYSFDMLEDLALAYCITVHKSQGSEFDAVIMPAFYTSPMLMKRNLLYTAVTRAKKLVVMVGASGAISAMVSGENDNKRCTSLLQRLR